MLTVILIQYFGKLEFETFYTVDLLERRWICLEKLNMVQLKHLGYGQLHMQLFVF